MMSDVVLPPRKPASMLRWRDVKRALSRVFVWCAMAVTPVFLTLAYVRAEVALVGYNGLVTPVPPLVEELLLLWVLPLAAIALVCSDDALSRYERFGARAAAAAVLVFPMGYGVAIIVSIAQDAW